MKTFLGSTASYFNKLLHQNVQKNVLTASFSGEFDIE
jgi:hypothetical protein